MILSRYVRASSHHIPVLIVALLLTGCARGALQSPNHGTDLGIETNLPALPVPLTGNAVASTTLDGRPHFYSFLGEAESGFPPRNPADNSFTLDPAEGVWKAVTRLPIKGPRRAEGAVALGGQIYILASPDAGSNHIDAPGRLLWAYDPTSGRYERQPPIPTPVEHSMLLGYGDRYVYIIGGRHRGSGISLVQVFDTQEQRWFAATDFPSLAVFGHSGALVGDTFLVTDGAFTHASDTIPPALPPAEMLGQAWLGVISPDDPSLIDWRRVAGHPGPALLHAGAGAIDSLNWIIITGGSTAYYCPTRPDDIGKGRPTDTVFAFDLTEENWVALGRRPFLTMDHDGMIVDGERAYTVGGTGPGGKPTGAMIEVPLGPAPSG